MIGEYPYECETKNNETDKKNGISNPRAVCTPRSVVDLAVLCDCDQVPTNHEKVSRLYTAQKEAHHAMCLYRMALRPYMGCWCRGFRAGWSESDPWNSWRDARHPCNAKHRMSWAKGISPIVELGVIITEARHRSHAGDHHSLPWVLLSCSPHGDCIIIHTIKNTIKARMRIFVERGPRMHQAINWLRATYRCGACLSKKSHRIAAQPNDDE